MCSPMMRRSIGAIPSTTVAQVEHGRLQHLLAAEREELVREVRRAVRRVDDLAQIRPPSGCSSDGVRISASCV